MSTRMPMFPLGTVLLPFGALSLHVFESRYRVLMFDCLRGDRQFGVVLIERGSEVGGDHQRFQVATVATIIEANELRDGRWILVALGTRRIDVVQWLPDDPYPVALVDDRAEQPWPGPGTTGADDANIAFAAADGAVRRSLALSVKAGEVDHELASGLLELSDDRAVASWQLLTASPLESLDKQRLLAMDDHVERLQTLTALAEDRALLLAYRLTGE